MLLDQHGAVTNILCAHAHAMAADHQHLEVHTSDDLRTRLLPHVSTIRQTLRRTDYHLSVT